MSIEREIEKCVFDVCRSGDIQLVLNASSDDMSMQMASFENSIESAMHDFQHWVTSNSLGADDIWYADLFRIEGPQAQKHVASLYVEPDDVSVRFIPAPEGSRLELFCRKPGIRRRLRSLKWQLSRS